MKYRVAPDGPASEVTVLASVAEWRAQAAAANAPGTVPGEAAAEAAAPPPSETGSEPCSASVVACPGCGVSVTYVPFASKASTFSLDRHKVRALLAEPEGDDRTPSSLAPRPR